MVPRILYLHPKTYNPPAQTSRTRRSLPSCQAIAGSGTELGGTYQR
jgi:hypothetical protein